MSDTEVVIAVPKGNPKQNQEPRGPGQAPVCVWPIGQPEQCTIGVLTRQVLEAEKVLRCGDEKRGHPDGDFSPADCPGGSTGAADASLAYLTDTKAESEQGRHAVRISSEAALAIQPFSIARSSRNRSTSPGDSDAVRLTLTPGPSLKQAGFPLAAGRRRLRSPTEVGSTDRHPLCQAGYSTSKPCRPPTTSTQRTRRTSRRPTPRSMVSLGLISGVYIVLLLGLLVADVAYMGTGRHLAETVSLAAGWLDWARPVLKPFLAIVRGTPELPRSDTRSS